MGNRFTVLAWLPVEGSTADFKYKEVWRGEEFSEALLEMAKAKKHGAGCVRLEWRGEPEGEL